AFLRDRILGASFVGVAPIAKEIQDTVRWCGQGDQEILRQPAHDQMDVPIPCFEQTPKAPGCDAGGGPSGHLFQGVSPRVHRLHEDEPAEDEAMATAPHGGHTAKHQSHETREVGEGHYHAQRSLHRGPKKKADNGNPYGACTPFSFDLQELDGLGAAPAKFEAEYPLRSTAMQSL